MLDRQIQRERSRAVQAVLYQYRELYLPHVMLVPSARFGLYATAKSLLCPGDRVLVSPITCRTVIHALLAAGVTPVFVDIELNTGNIDVSRLSKAELSSARAIVTTNLYGNPDAVHDLKAVACSHSLLLIEDCAHVLRTRSGTQEIGSVGDVSIFSFKKHFDEAGGVLCTRDAAAANKIQARVLSEATLPLPREERLRYCQYRLTRATSPAIARSLSSVYRYIGNAGGTRENDRQPTSANAEKSPALVACLPTTASLLRMADYLQTRQELIRAKTSAAMSLIAQCPLPIKGDGRADDTVYLAVPFFCSDRDPIVAELQSRGIPTYFLYTPPMSTVFRGRAQSIHDLDEERIQHWCRTTLPVLPEYGQQFLEVFGQMASVGHGNPGRGYEVTRNQLNSAGR